MLTTVSYSGLKYLMKSFSEINIPVPWGHIAGKIWKSDSSIKKNIVCIHGWLDNCNSFEPLIKLLPNEYTYLAIDLPGHGKSSNYPIGFMYYFADWVFHIDRIIKHMKWDKDGKVTLMGHSMGAGISLLYASLFPKIVDQVISLDILAPFILPTESCYDIFQQSIRLHQMHEQNPTMGDKPYTREAAISRLLEFKSLTESSAELMLERGMEQRENNDHYIMRRDMRLHYRTPMYYSDAHWKIFLSKLCASTLVILGKDSSLKGEVIKESRYAEYDALFHDQLGAKYTKLEFPGTHHLHMNTPELIVPSITNFLDTT